MIKKVITITLLTFLITSVNFYTMEYQPLQTKTFTPDQPLSIGDKKLISVTKTKTYDNTIIDFEAQVLDLNGTREILKIKETNNSIVGYIRPITSYVQTKLDDALAKSYFQTLSDLFIARSKSRKG